ncbi:hypothetical protein ACEYW6_14755 [Nostoc sp. UIC 10607]|uniref:hypothetical protein n=1 Tax=Nostoc sp. UIC 10607 TaxID=3045935 RepID=UPI00399F137D
MSTLIEGLALWPTPQKELDVFLFGSSFADVQKGKGKTFLPSLFFDQQQFQSPGVTSVNGGVHED